MLQGAGQGGVGAEHQRQPNGDRRLLLVGSSSSDRNPQVESSPEHFGRGVELPQGGPGRQQLKLFCSGASSACGLLVFGNVPGISHHVVGKWIFFFPFRGIDRSIYVHLRLIVLQLEEPD